MEKKTSDEWKKLLNPYDVIFNPDGWDRTNFKWSYYEELITRDEYHARLSDSTIYLGNPLGESVDAKENRGQSGSSVVHSKHPWDGRFGMALKKKRAKTS